MPDDRHTGPAQPDTFRPPSANKVPLVGISVDGTDLAGDSNSPINASDTRELSLEALQGILAELREISAKVSGDLRDPDMVLRDGRGTTRRMLVDAAGAARVAVNPLPPFGGAPRMRVFRQYLTDDGLSTGSTDMRVDGSSANVDFWVPADPTEDRYLCLLSFVVSDALAALNSFGTLSALSNGCRLFYSDEMGEVDIHDALKTNFDFVRLCAGQPAFGDGNNSFRANNISGNSEGFIPVLDLRMTFGFEWGVRLAAGSQQWITLRVRDDTTGVDAFDCIAYGFERSAD